MVISLSRSAHLKSWQKKRQREDARHMAAVKESKSLHLLRSKPHGKSAPPKRFSDIFQYSKEVEAMLIKFLKPDFMFENESGSLKQLVHDGWKQVNVIASLPGSVRGGHYHKFNQEGFYIIKGSFTLRVWNAERAETYEIQTGDMFLIPPYVFHTFEYHEETVLVSMYSQGVELSKTEKDIWTE